LIISAPVAISIITLFCLQALLFALLLLLKKPHTQANFLLSVLLSFFALTAFNLALFYMLVLLDHTEIIPYVQLELLFGLGPSLYLYTKSVTDPGYKISRLEYFHFLPVVLEFIYYRTSYYRNGTISFTESHRNALNWIFISEQWLGTLTASIYIACSLKLLFNYHIWVKNNYANLHRVTLKWLIKPVIAYASFWVLWHIIRMADLFIYADAYRGFYFYPMFIILSAITCWIGFKGYMKTQIDAIGFIIDNKARNRSLPHQLTTPTATGRLIKDAMEKEKLYLDMDLNMDLFSNKLGLNPKLVSKVINTELNMNFHEFVNQYRVLEFMDRLKQPGHEKLTIWGHALESGFASKSTFNHIFKKYSQLTPKAYYQQIRNDYRVKMSEKMIPDD
jgi:AraC-like DNA-binding protein